MNDVKKNDSLLALSTWTEIHNCDVPFFVLATGSIEQHGPHLPLATDHMVASRIAEEVTGRFSAVQLPSVPFGVNFAFQDWPGSMGLSANTYTQLLLEVGVNASRLSSKLLVICGHDENQASLSLVARELVSSYGMEVVFFEWAELVLDVIKSISESDHEMHAGEGLTSLFLYWFPEHVRKKNITKGELSPSGLTSDDIHDDYKAIHPRQFEFKPTLTGIYGDPSLASAQKGGIIARSIIERVIQLIQELGWRGMSVDEG